MPLTLVHVHVGTNASSIVLTIDIPAPDIHHQLCLGDVYQVRASKHILSGISYYLKLLIMVTINKSNNNNNNNNNNNGKNLEYDIVYFLVFSVIE